ncbi:MAG: flagella basal body P-ring formation protein FlgA [Pseudonocardiales bacterium]|nr:flagella basal body P-ring formation protein FlgA [Pseudonocardiales bacterium]MBV9030107.1 flagella basal body P-ring formation protein FlgA [Pseudonocardiales bacterium]MBW0009546.1 flagella basal body P-ring formation protein FlgA [Pseudonocardiales bacterium]
MRQWGDQSGPRTLAPLLRERCDGLLRWSGFGRTLVLRRVAAAALVGLAAVLALAPGQAPSTGDTVVVAARDLTPGTVLEASELTLRALPAPSVPDGTARSPTAVLGRTLAAPVRRGEPLTDVRLTGSDLARTVTTNPDAVSVPLRLADPGVAALLHPGAAVDVVTVGERRDEPVVLARGARVLAVLEAGTHAEERDGKLVLVALDPVAATRVAAASISQTLSVTVH